MQQRCSGQGFGRRRLCGEMDRGWRSLSPMSCLAIWYTYLRVISCQTVSSQGMHRIASSTIALAEAEGLKGHAESLRARATHA